MVISRTLLTGFSALLFAAAAQAAPEARDADRKPAAPGVGSGHHSSVRVAKKGGTHHSSHKPAHHSAPRHVAHAVHHAVHHIVHHHPTRAFRKTVNVNVNVNAHKNGRHVNGSATVVHHAPSYSSRAYYRRPNTYNNYYYTRHSYQQGMYSWRHHSYRRHHHHRNRHVVRGIVAATSGNANNGTVEVRTLPNQLSRFRRPAEAGNGNKNGNIAASGALRQFQVNGSTRYEIMANQQGVFHNGSFAKLHPGEPVLIMTANNGSHVAQTIETFPASKLLAARAP